VKRICLLTAFVMALATLAGCQGHLAMVAATSPARELRSAQAYHYYTAAQLARRNGNLVQAGEWLRQAMAADPDSAWLRLELARLAIEEGDTAAAVRLIEENIKVHPDHIASLHLLGVLQDRLDQPQAAIDAFEKVIRLDPEAENAYLFLGAIHRKAQDWENARRVYREMVTHFPSSYLGHLFLGQAASRLGQAQEAEAHLRQALFVEPEMEAPRFELIQLFRALSDADAGERAEQITRLYKEILDLDPTNARAIFELSLIYDELAHTDEVRQLLGPLAVQSRTDPGPIQVFIELYLETRNYFAAAILLEHMLSADPDNDTLHYFRGVVFNELERRQEALASFDRVRPDSQYFHNASAHMAFIYQQQGQIPEAIARLNQVLAQDPDNPEIFHYLGSFYEEMEDFQQAAQLLEKGVALDPDNTAMLFRLGVVYDKAGRKQECIETMKAVVAKDPENANALNYLGYTYADLGVELDAAEQFIQQALRIKPEDGYIIDSLGWVYYQKGLYRQALEQILRAVALVPQDPVILEHLGDVREKLGQWAKALEAYEKALGLAEKGQDGLNAKIQRIREALAKPGSP